MKRNLFEERQTKETELKLIEFNVTIELSKKVNISEVLTAIRIAQGVATATQQDPAVRSPSGLRRVKLVIRFVPEGGAPKDQVHEVAETLRLKGIRTIRINARENAPVLKKSGKKFKKFVISGPG